MTWQQAEDRAVSLGGHLATIRSQSEQAWLSTVFGIQDLWIGLTDEAVEGTFSWSSGEPFVFANWAPGEPNNFGEEDFVVSSAAGWKDAAGSQVRQGIVEISEVPRYMPFGAGCAGSAGIPVLAAAPGNLPLTDETFNMQLTNLPPGNGTAFLVFGFSKTDWAGIPLPADLTPFGIFGCSVYVSVDTSFPVATAGGAAQFALPIPNEPSLLGVRFFNQGLVLDPGINAFGAVVSNAAEGIVGLPTFEMAVTVLGGRMGTTPQPNVRVLRHDVVTGALLDDQLTDANGVADFGMIFTPRTTITVVEPPEPPFFGGALSTIEDLPAGAVTLMGGPEPASLATFDVMMTGVPAGADRAGAYLATPGASDELFVSSLTPPTATVLGARARYLQPDGRFSLVTEAGIDGVGLTGCGLLLDVDPASILPGSVLSVDTSMSPSTIPFTANVPVWPVGTLMRRKGLSIDADLAPPAVPVTTGMLSFCNIPGADRYVFFFEGVASAARGVVFDALPGSIDVTIPSLAVTGLSRDANTQTFTWMSSGSDLGDIDAVTVEIAWITSTFREWTVIAPEGRTSLTLPALPADLAAFMPPATGVEFSVELADLDTVGGFDDLISQITAMEGSIESVVYAASSLSFACEEGSN